MGLGRRIELGGKEDGGGEDGVDIDLNIKYKSDRRRPTADGLMT